MIEPTKTPTKWYYSDGSLFILFITVGPLAIPLVWKNPRYNIRTKWLVTSVMLVLTVVMSWVFFIFFQKILAYYQLLAETSV